MTISEMTLFWSKLAKRSVLHIQGRDRAEDSSNIQSKRPRVPPPRATNRPRNTYPPFKSRKALFDRLGNDPRQHRARAGNNRSAVNSDMLKFNLYDKTGKPRVRDQNI